MNLNDYRQTTIEQLLTGLEAGHITSVGLVQRAIDMIQQQDKQGPAYNAVTWLFAVQALEAAEQSDLRRQQGRPAGLLEGIPVLVKDNIDVAGWPTTAGSLALTGIIADRDADIVTALRREGAIIIGKTAMHELAAGITGASSFSGFTRNAWVPGYSPGGSSSGSAVAVAAGYVPLAIGTDTAGSVRIPAAFNGVVGLRPSSASLSLRGIVPLSPTQDAPGPLLWHASDLPRVMAVLRGRPVPANSEAIRTGYLAEWCEGENSVARVVQSAVGQLQEAGVAIKKVSAPSLTEQSDAANVIAFEFAQALEQDLRAGPGSRYTSLAAIVQAGIHHPQLDAVFRTRAEHPGMDDDRYADVIGRQRALYERLTLLFTQQQINLLVYPVAGETPVKNGGMQTGSHGLLAAVTGMPALSLPAGITHDGFPVGLELLALKGQESLLIQAAAGWQRTLLAAQGLNFAALADLRNPQELQPVTQGEYFVSYLSRLLLLYGFFAFSEYSTMFATLFTRFYGYLMRPTFVLLSLLTLLTACSSKSETNNAAAGQVAPSASGFLNEPEHGLQPVAGDFAGNPAAEQFIERMVAKHSFDRAWLHSMLGQARRLDSVLRLMDRQAPAYTPPAGPNGAWLRYRKKFITPDNLQNGVAFWNQHQETLQRAQQQYGVPAEIIVGIIGVETRWGRILGKTRILDAPATLSFNYPRRAAYFTGELETFLLMARNEQSDPLNLRGSFAGAMGLGQFMPSSYQQYAVDFNGDGHINLWDPEDAIGSVAHYFQAHGWQSGEPVAVPATGQAPNMKNGFRTRYTVDALAAAGLTPQQPIGGQREVSLLRLDLGTSYQYWYGLPNFYTITRYNHSTHYAMAVWQLGEAVSKARHNNLL